VCTAITLYHPLTVFPLPNLFTLGQFFFCVCSIHPWTFFSPAGPSALPRFSPQSPISDLSQQVTSGSESDHTLYTFTHIDPAWLPLGNPGPLSGNEQGLSSNTPISAGQDEGVYTETWPNTQNIGIAASSSQPFQLPERNNDLYQDFYTSATPEASGPSTATQTNIESFQCPTCFDKFPKPYLLNRHVKQKHDRPYECTESEECRAVFGSKKDLDRHINDIHQSNSRFYCPHEGCKYSQEQGDGFSRKDNRDRHIRTRHSAHLPL